MKRNTLYLVIVAIVLVAVAVIVVPTMLAGNDADDQPTQQDQSPDAAEAPELTENENTALEAAEIMTTWEPADDHNRTAAELRARHLMTDDRADEIVEPDRQAPGKYWNIAAEQHATSQPDVKINEHTDAEEGTVSVIATWEWATEDGETLESNGQQRIYYFTFNDQGEIHDYTYETVRHSQPPEKEN